MINTIIFISGTGTNMRAVVECARAGVLPIHVAAVISNCACAGTEWSREQGISTHVLEPLPKEKRVDYDRRLLALVRDIHRETPIELDSGAKRTMWFGILAGWMRILSADFIMDLGFKLINLHPALPGMFPGADGIGDAFRAFQRGEIKETGIMCHYVVPEVDAGEVIRTTTVPIYEGDTVDILRERVRYLEKSVLIGAICDVCEAMNQLKNKVVVTADHYTSCMRYNHWSSGNNILGLYSLLKVYIHGRIHKETMSKKRFNYVTDVLRRHSSLYLALNCGHLDVVRSWNLSSGFRQGNRIFSESELNTVCIGGHVHILHYIFTHAIIPSTMRWNKIIPGIIYCRQWNICRYLADRDVLIDIVEFLVEVRGDNDLVNILEHGNGVAHITGARALMLILACYRRNLSLVKYILQLEGVSINMCGDLPLYTAIKVGSLRIIRYLVQHGANIHTDNASYWACIWPIHETDQWTQYKRIIKFLIEKGADVNKALRSICNSGDLPDGNLSKIVKSLIRYGADIHTKSSDILYLAITCANNDKLTKYLLKQGALIDPSLFARNDRNPLQQYFIDNRIPFSGYLSNTPTPNSVFITTVYNGNNTLPPIYTGKVRRLDRISNDMYMITASDRLSAFDRHICDIPGKGEALTAMTAFWMQASRHIIPNHMIGWTGNRMIVHACTPILVEVVVRGFMCGTTETSIWTHYKEGSRTYCGHQLRDGYRLYDELDEVLVTPTTKGKRDELISGFEVVERGLVPSDMWGYIEEKAKKLYAFGREEACKRGYILVDTKYEFGVLLGADPSLNVRNIRLIDEMHTCDSSRYWTRESYERFTMGEIEQPVSVDKDVIRRWVRERCDPYKDAIPAIPDELKEHTAKVYKSMIFSENV